MFISKVDLQFKIISNERFPTPICLSVLWNLGFILLILSVIQIISGLFLCLYLNVGFDTCLLSKMFIVKEISLGWLNSYVHAILPSVLFLFLYVHIFRGLLYPIYNYFLLWGTGFLLYVLFCSIAFTGYCLVGGSMSYWALIVIRNILAFILGEMWASLLLFNEIGDSTFNKVFTYHFLLGLLSILFIGIHVKILHLGGSSNGFTYSFVDNVNFSLILLIKDLLGFEFVLMSLLYILGFYPEEFFSYDTYSMIDRLAVPEEISPEWFLRFYFVVLKSVSDKGLGIFLMILILILLGVKPFFRGVFGGGVLLESGFLIFILLGGFSYSILQFYGGTYSYILAHIALVFLVLDLDFLLILSSFFELLQQNNHKK